MKRGNVYSAAEIGKHVFELAGLGKAPFKFVGIFEKVFKAGNVVKPGGSCHFCGTGIRYCCEILSSDGKRFVVGTDCVDKTGDYGIIQAYKNSDEFLTMKREMRHAREQQKIDQLKVWLADESIRAQLAEMPDKGCHWKAQSMLDKIEWYMKNSGNSGMCSMYSFVKRTLGL